MHNYSNHIHRSPSYVHNPLILLPTYNSNQIKDQIKDERIVIVSDSLIPYRGTLPPPDDILAVRYQTETSLANALYNYILSPDFTINMFTNILDNYRTRNHDTSVDINVSKDTHHSHYLSQVITDIRDHSAFTSGSFHGEFMVDIEEIHRVYKNIPSLAMYNPIRIEIHPMITQINLNINVSQEEKIYDWVKTWFISHIQQINPVNDSISYMGNAPNYVLMLIIYIVLGDLVNSNKLMKYANATEVTNLIVSPDFYIARDASSFALHHDRGQSLNYNPADSVVNYTGFIDSFSLLYLPLNKDVLMRSASITAKPYNEYLLNPDIHPSFNLKLLSLPIIFGSSLYLDDIRLLHTTPQPTIPIENRVFLGPTAPDRNIKIYEQKTNLIKREDARDIERTFPELRTYIRIRYLNPEDPIAPLFNMVPVEVDNDDNIEVGQLQLLESTVTRLLNNNGLMGLKSYLMSILFKSNSITNVVGDFTGITTIRGFGKNKSHKRKHKRINKTKRKQTRIHKRKRNHPIIK